MTRALPRIAIAACAVAASLATSLVQAVDFDDVDPLLFAAGDSFDTGGYRATVFGGSSEVGLNAVIADGADPTSCFVIDCPLGNGSHFFLGVNDGGIEFSRPGAAGGFRASSFDASFVAPVVGLPLADSVARLQVYGFTVGSNRLLQTSFALPGQNAEGSFSFAAFSLAGTPLAGVSLSSIGLYACLTDGGRCLFPADNQAQFALDNVVLTPVPEPSTAALCGLGALLMLGLARRRSGDAA